MAGDPIVAVASVTYGDRRHLLEQVREGLDAQTRADAVEAVVVVDNGSSPETKAFLEEWGAEDDRLVVPTLEENRGPAHGYARAIEEAAQRGDLVWCLDDDNRPDPDALEALLEARTQVGDESALVSLRPERGQYAARGRGLPAEEAFPAPGTFLGFDVSSVWARLPGLGAPDDGPPDQEAGEDVAEDPLPIPYGPYGGLLFPAEALDEAGPPRRDLVISSDDHEFTRRLARAGYPLYLVPGSVVQDVEVSDYEADEGAFVDAFLGSGRPERDRQLLYYRVRNRTYVEAHGLDQRSSIRWRLNSWLFPAILLGVGLLRRRPGQAGPLAAARTVWRARRDGLAGRLEPLEDGPF